MSRCWRVAGQRRRTCGIIVVIFFLLMGGFCEATAGPPGSAAFTRLVLIDPGHGGNDTGVRGSGGTLEKDVTLALARLLVTRLGGAFVAKLSRTDDYHLDIISRANLANQENAAIFISLHTGGSFRHGSSGAFLYYYRGPERTVFGGNISLDRPYGLSDSPEPWREAQRKHVPASRYMARSIQKRLVPYTGASGVAAGASLAMLAGIDRPAVLIEVGNLSNPADEKKLKSPDYLAGMADAISAGISDFFRENSAISSMDLHQ